MVDTTRSVFSTERDEEEEAKRKQLDELKSKFTKRNKVSTFASYENKQRRMPSQIISRPSSQNKDASSATDRIDMTRQSQQELEAEIKLAAAAYADAERGLENLALFNEEMSSISMNAFQLYTMFEIISKENEEIISQMQQIER